MTTRAAWGSETRARRVTGAQGPQERLVLGGRWAVASPLRSRPPLAQACPRRQRPGGSGHRDATARQGHGQGE